MSHTQEIGEADGLRNDFKLAECYFEMRLMYKICYFYLRKIKNLVCESIVILYYFTVFPPRNSVCACVILPGKLGFAYLGASATKWADDIGCIEIRNNS